jgi:hypothetical protein
MPEKDNEFGGFKSVANIKCHLFEKDVSSTGEDEAQSFFSLPNIVVSYLIGRRRYGHIVFWMEVGDLEYSDFWAYKE